MGKKEKMKLAFLFLGIVVLMVGFWFVLRRVEGGADAKMTDEFLVEDTEPSSVEEEKKPVGTIKLAGQKYDYYDDIESYLLMGTDASGNESEEGEKYQGNMADFLLLMVIDKTTKEYGFLQLNRDTMTEINLILKDGTGQAKADLQLCTAHWYGGTPEQSCENTVKAVSKLLGGLPIDGYYALNMDKISDLNHDVGGVEVTLEEDFTDIDSAMKKGAVLRLSDEQAYHYIHDRFGVGDEKNSSRMKRQKEYMKKLFEQIGQKMSDKPAFLNDIFNKYKKDATTDITMRQLSRLTEYLNEGYNKGTLLLKGEEKLGQALGDGIDHVEFYPTDKSLVDAMITLCGIQKR